MMYRYCPHCGTELLDAERSGRLRSCCTACGFVHYRNPTVGVAVIVLRDGQILLGRRRADSSFPGHWCIPCGHVEYDEEVRAAAVREFAEETGLIVQLGDVAAVHSNFHCPDHQTVGIWFFGTVAGGELQPGDDLDAVAYFDLNALSVPLAYPTDRQVLAQLQHDLRQQ